jgi:hypothetical protein
MKTAAAQLPEGGGEDRVFATDDAVIVLDGASAFRPVPVRPSEYVDVLGAELVAHLDPSRELPTILGKAIEATARRLELAPGHSPSSTVAIVRTVTDQVECLVLGDNLIVFPDATVTDDRLERLAQEEQARYRDRLRTGHGYDEGHRAALKRLQAKQARYRNRPGGYWIAEADPQAANHAIIVRRPIGVTPWAVLSSDGAYKPMAHLGLADWPSLAAADDEELEQVLTECLRWESDEDPNGMEFPRAKRHDDKTLAAARFEVATCRAR